MEHDPGVKEIFGFGPGEGERVEDYTGRIHPDDRRAWLDALARCRREGADLDQQYRVVWPDGSVRWVRDTGTMARDEDGAPLHLAGAVVDFTEVKQLQEREEAARARAEDASRAKDEFLAMLGHELRNPLSPIVTALQLMKLRGDIRSTREQDVIQRQVTHLVRLVDDLLDVARITRGKVELRKEPLQLAEAAAKAVEMASPLFEQRHHTLRVDIPRHGLRIDADPVRLAQVISNLLTNAARYTEPGGRITLVARREDGHAVITVKDTGIGIGQDLLPRIFALFVQGRRGTDRAEGGLGLGLTLVRTLVRLHGGTVTARSEGVGRGSEFEVRLPALADLGTDGAPRTATAVARESPAASTPRRVLVVDDNRDAAETLAEVLRAVGHDVVVAHDGPQALAAAERFRPEVAVLDVGLPVMDGFELATHLRSRPPTARCRLVALTGYGQERDRARSREAGFDLHLVKPVDAERLLGAIEGEAERRWPEAG